MTAEKTCGVCGAFIPALAPAGQCINCLLRLAMVPDRPDASLPILDAVAGSANYPKPFADYDLLKLIARSGMSVVYKAQHRQLHRTVALKMVLAGQLATESELRRFLTEAEAAANLDHPNIVPIYEVGECDGQHYFTMKLIEGGSLAEWVEQRGSKMEDAAKTAFGEPTPGPSREGNQATNVAPLQGGVGGGFRGTMPAESPESSLLNSPRSIARLVSKIASAIHYAHQHGILHRDLKPSNILLDAQGEPHVTDFGLAKLLHADSSLTHTDAILGSPNYMAPEQAAGKVKQLTVAADIYSLGVILFQLLTGRLPFNAANPLEMIRQVVEGIPARARAINPHLDRDLETICLKCLEKEPERRYASAKALGEDLDRWLEQKPIAARRNSPLEHALKWGKRNPLKAALLAVILLAITGPWLVWRVYVREMPRMATEHPIVTPDRDWVYWLPLWHAYKADRCTDNFWRGPMEQRKRQLRLEFTNVPPEMLSSLGCVIRADMAGRPDPARTPLLTNGQTFWLKVESDLERSFYVASVGWHASNVLARASNASIRLVLFED